MRRIGAALAVGMAVLYLAVLIEAAGCLSMHEPPSPVSHHHGSSHSAHSLCASVCQGSPLVAVLSVVSAGGILPVASRSIVFVSRRATTVLFPIFPSRAPPHSVPA
ncbi:MAG TPA: hypothetical protein VFS39_09995 [Nitrospira sp.]|nr:hypothetical protein [Nitrospira sp.]